jgi:hypothetical protein
MLTATLAPLLPMNSLPPPALMIAPILLVPLLKARPMVT